MLNDIPMTFIPVQRLYLINFITMDELRYEQIGWTTGSVIDLVDHARSLGRNRHNRDIYLYVSNIMHVVYIVCLCSLCGLQDQLTKAHTHVLHHLRITHLVPLETVYRPDAQSQSPRMQLLFAIATRQSSLLLHLSPTTICPHSVLLFLSINPGIHAHNPKTQWLLFISGEQSEEMLQGVSPTNQGRQTVLSELE